ncbi:MAG: hypothetical protein MST01_01360 [Prevotella sp.]|nr:hypothetical protein [Prevotella sp.]
MKTIATVFLTLLVSLQMMAGKVIKIQDIEYAPSWMAIKDVELTKESTIIRGTLQPGASILKNTVIVDRNTGKKYKFLRVEVSRHTSRLQKRHLAPYISSLSTQMSRRLII